MQQNDWVTLAHFHVCHLAAEDLPPLLLVWKCRSDHARFSCLRSVSILTPYAEVVGPSMEMVSLGRNAYSCRSHRSRSESSPDVPPSDLGPDTPRYLLTNPIKRDGDQG